MPSIDDSGLLTANASRQLAPVRPPWSLPEAMFLALCNGCDGCRDECPRGLLRKGADGYPFIDFTQGMCNFCGECVDACARGALTRRYHGVTWGPWRLKARIAGDCLGSQGVVCRQCVAHCRVHAIHLAWADGGFLPSVDVQVCNGCGACFASCPAEAIHLYDEASA